MWAEKEPEFSGKFKPSRTTVLVDDQRPKCQFKIECLVGQVRAEQRLHHCNRFHKRFQKVSERDKSYDYGKFKKGQSSQFHESFVKLSPREAMCK